MLTGLSAMPGRRVAIALVVLLTGPTLGQTDPGGAYAERREAARLVEQGNVLMAEGKHAEALAAYDEAAKRLPESPEVAYNRGLALYRLGRFDQAEPAFQDALKADRPELEARAKYNLGRAVHAAAEAAAGQGELPQAADELQRAIRYYQDALQIAPQDADAVKNKELAGRLLAYLKKLMEEQEKKDQPTSQPESQPSSQPTSQPTSQPSSQPSSQPQEQQGEGQDNEEQGDQKKDANEAEGKEQDDQQDSEAKDAKKINPEEAEKILQQARDAERERREAKKREAMRLGRIRVDKDW